MAYTTIDDPSAHFQTQLWTGNGASSDRNITNTGNSDLQPDMIWGACRSHVQHRHATDSSRGWSTGNKEMPLNYNNAEGDTGAINTGAYGWLGPSITDGFTSNYGSVNNGYWNVDTRTYCAWQWKANGGTTTSVSSSGTGSGCVNACTYQANTTAGFSIITYTGRDDQLNNGQHSLLKHGLGTQPDLIIVRRRDAVGNWMVMGRHVTSASAYSNNEYMSLNATSAINGNSYTGSVAPTTTDIYLGNDLVNIASATYVAYVFNDVKGYSKFGTYTGNGDTNGPVVYTGFKPEFVMIKNCAVANMWNIYDGQRKRQNSDYVNMFYMNGTNVEYTGASYHNLDILSNGFKIRLTDASQNGNGNKHIYMAFAKSPFVSSTGVPATAR